MNAGQEAAKVTLRAGPLALRFEGGDLRYIRLGRREVVRRIYGTVRVRNWGTVPGEISGLEIHRTEDAFRLHYVSTHQQDGIDLVWHADFEGTAGGTICCRFDGEARSEFLRNRIGLCILHPLRECMVARCRAKYADGRTGEARFPDYVTASQPLPGLDELAGLAYEVEPGTWAELEFLGDIFEMEDQRNWLDASFKTFCTPLRLPVPVLIAKGTRIQQEVVLKLKAEPPALASWSEPAPPAREDSIILISAANETTPIPPIGLGASSRGNLLTTRESLRLRALGLGHLRVDVPDLGSPGTLEEIYGFREATTLGIPVELAIDLDRRAAGVTPAHFLERLAVLIEREQVRLARVYVFGLGESQATSEAALRLARAYLGRFGAPVGGGSNADLYELNLFPPPNDVQGLVWPINPQIHARDNTSIAETPETVPHQIASVRRLHPGLPLGISPVTLVPRPNAVTEPTGFTPITAPPPNADPRQSTLFAAAWTVGILKGVLEGGVTSATFFETVGWRGVMEIESGSLPPAPLESVRGGVFPVYHIFADLADFTGGSAIATQSSEPLAVSSLLLARGKKRRLMLANLTPESRSVKLLGFARTVVARVLDESAASQAMMAPEAFRAQQIHREASRFDLHPYAVASLDFAVP